MTNSISTISIVDVGYGLINAEWELVGNEGALLMRGLLVTTSKGYAVSADAVSRGYGYTVDPVSTDVKIYYPGTKTLLR